MNFLHEFNMVFFKSSWIWYSVRQLSSCIKYGFFWKPPLWLSNLFIARFVYSCFHYSIRWLGKNEKFKTTCAVFAKNGASNMEGRIHVYCFNCKFYVKFWEDLYLASKPSQTPLSVKSNTSPELISMLHQSWALKHALITRGEVYGGRLFVPNTYTLRLFDENQIFGSTLKIYYDYKIKKQV